jgi:hypothetical protein
MGYGLLPWAMAGEHSIVANYLISCFLINQLEALDSGTLGGGREDGLAKVITSQAVVL